MDKLDIKSLSLPELCAYMETIQEKPFRAGQVYSWLHQKQVCSFQEMTNLSGALRNRLEEECTLARLPQAECLISKKDGTRKYAFFLEDGHIIESVWMQYKHGNSVCISSQVGCRMGCHFCASSLDGLVRGLTPAEMLEQVYEIERDTGERVSHVVVMGTGEPLDNMDNLIRFIRRITDEKGHGISQRNITVSTCGLVPQIHELAGEHLGITLALSLHAPNDALRKTMMPIANAYTVEETLNACQAYFQATGRRVSIEYSLIQGINDGKQAAEQLGRLLKGRGFHVNLIPVNPIKERSYKGTEVPQVENFKKNLEKSGINVTIRRRMGVDIESACGQLRRKVRQKETRKGAHDIE